MPEASLELSSEQVSTRGQILETLVDELQRARLNFFDAGNFIETDDTGTRGVFIQEGQSHPQLDALARDPNQPNRAARVKETGEIVIDQSVGRGEYTKDIVVFSDLDAAQIVQAGFSGKPELIEWVRDELGYATEVANSRLGMSVIPIVYHRCVPPQRKSPRKNKGFVLYQPLS